MKGTVTVMGTGRVGLPLALFISSKGFKVYGLDVDPIKIEQIKSGVMPFREIDGEKFLTTALQNGFAPTTDISCINHSDVIILTLGTPVDEFLNPDYKQLHMALETMIPHLKENQLIILRSTVSPKTTEYMKEQIESRKGFTIGKNFFLAFCPERIAQGFAFKELEELPEIVGGVDEQSTQKAVEFFKNYKKEVLATSAINAELLKLFTNMYRYINFAIANEFLVIAEHWGGSIHEIVKMANKNYPRDGLKSPGFTAGPCLFKDGFFLTSGMPFPELINAAWSINEGMPAYLVNKVKNLTSLKGKNCLIMGMSFKSNNDDQRASLSHKLKKVLKREMANVQLHDVYTHDSNFEDHLKESDVVFIATPHDEYKKDLAHYKNHMRDGAIVVDIWNTLKQKEIIFKIEK